MSLSFKHRKLEKSYYKYQQPFFDSMFRASSFIFFAILLIWSYGEFFIFKTNRVGKWLLLCAGITVFVMNILAKRNYLARWLGIFVSLFSGLSYSLFIAYQTRMDRITSLEHYYLGVALFLYVTLHIQIMPNWISKSIILFLCVPIL